MTTSRSPLSELRNQADAIAMMLKAFQRGDPINPQFAAQIEAARANESLKMAIAMDDRILMIEMPWAQIEKTSEAGLSEYIVRQMRESRETTH